MNNRKALRTEADRIETQLQLLRADRGRLLQAATDYRTPRPHAVIVRAEDRTYEINYLQGQLYSLQHPATTVRALPTNNATPLN